MIDISCLKCFRKNIRHLLYYQMEFMSYFSNTHDDIKLKEPILINRSIILLLSFKDFAGAAGVFNDAVTSDDFIASKCSVSSE